MTNNEILKPATATDVKYYPHAFTPKQVVKYYNGWRPSKVLVLWWEIKLSIKEFLKEKL